MKQKLMVVLLAVLIACGFAGCAGETRSPVQQAKIVTDYAGACFAAYMEAQGVVDYAVTGSSYSQTGHDNTLYQVFIDYRDGDGMPQTYSAVLRLENEAVVLLGEGDVESMKTLLLEEAG